MDYIPYSCQSISDDDIAAVVRVLKSEYLTQGPELPALESEFAGLHATRHAVAVANATAGLHLACLALGVGPSSIAWTSPNSFLASANCALYCGATVDFVDIDPFTRNMSVAALRHKLEQAASANRLPHVVIPVDFSGLPCDLAPMRALADQYGFKIIEDASHATGATYLGRPVGSTYADATVFSFHAVKIVTAAEGGMITVQDDQLAHQLRLLRSHGMTREAAALQHHGEGPWYYEQQELGFNYRMTDLQAALLRSQLQRLDDMHQARQALADRYDALLADLPVTLPPRQADRASAWHLYVIEVDEALRGEVFDGLRQAQIGANVHYIPIHTQPYYRARGFRYGDFPNSERYYRRAISIPLHPRLTSEHQERVASVLRKLIAHH